MKAVNRIPDSAWQAVPRASFPVTSPHSDRPELPAGDVTETAVAPLPARLTWLKWAGELFTGLILIPCFLALIAIVAFAGERFMDDVDAEADEPYGGKDCPNCRQPLIQCRCWSDE